MRVSDRLLALALLAALGACNRTASPPSADVATVAAAAGPQQAPGLWLQSVSDRRGVRTMRYCLDDAAAAALAAFNRQLNGRCSRHDIAKAADGTWHFSTSCDMGAWGGQVATEGVMHGDFATHYVVEANSQTVGAAQSAANGPARVSADIRRQGDCPADMKPGDVILPGGAHARVDQLSAHA